MTGQLSVGEIRTEAEVDTGAGAQRSDKPHPGWQHQATLRLLDEQIRCAAMRTAAFGNDD